MDAAHPLFEPVRVPRNVVIEHDVAALKIDAFASRFGRHQHLDRAFAKLLLGIEPASLYIT